MTDEAKVSYFRVIIKPCASTETCLYKIRNLIFSLPFVSLSFFLVCKKKKLGAEGAGNFCDNDILLALHKMF